MGKSCMESRKREGNRNSNNSGKIYIMPCASSLERAEETNETVCIHLYKVYANGRPGIITMN